MAAADPGGDLGARHAWEFASDAEDAEAGVNAEEAGAALVDFLMNLMWYNSLSAKSVCVLAYWITRAGACGAISTLAYPPGRASGKYQRHLDRLSGFKNADNTYHVDVPQHVKCDESRAVRPICTYPMEEALSQEISKNPALNTSMRTAIANNEMSPAYYEHPVVVANPGRLVHAYSIFVDGVPFTAHDGAIGFFCQNMVSGVRHCCAVIRKSKVCKCGCRGWCTLWCIFEWLHNSIANLAAGVFGNRLRTLSSIREEQCSPN